MNKYKFKDFYMGGIWNGLLAIEPEISRVMMERIANQFPNVRCKRESSNIREISNMHSLTTEEKLGIYNILLEFYNEKFPAGTNGYISGGVHFHLFNGDFNGLKPDRLRHNLLAAPLYCKIKGNKFYGRRLGNRAELSSLNSGGYHGDRLTNNSKGCAVTYKSSHSCGRFGKSLEFRLNNVFDVRLYGYYVAMVILTKDGVKLKDLVSVDEDYLSRGDQNLYSRDGDIGINSIAGARILEGGLNILKKNILTMLNTLCNNGLYESARALDEYLLEHGIDSGYTHSVKDMFSGETSDQMYKIDSMRIFREDITGLYFSSKETFCSYLKEHFKKKMKSMQIDSTVFSIDDTKFDKKYGKIFEEKAILI